MGASQNTFWKQTFLKLSEKWKGILELLCRLLALLCQPGKRERKWKQKGIASGPSLIVFIFFASLNLKYLNWWYARQNVPEGSEENFPIFLSYFGGEGASEIIMYSFGVFQLLFKSIWQPPVLWKRFPPQIWIKDIFCFCLHFVRTTDAYTK